MPAGAGGCGSSAAPSGAARAAAGGMLAPREPVMLARGRHACARLGQPVHAHRQDPFAALHLHGDTRRRPAVRSIKSFTPYLAS